MEVSLNKLEGQRFGRLIVLNRAANINRNTRYLCVCDCGNTKEIYGHNLLRGTTKSCGCLRFTANRKHGFLSKKNKHKYKFYRAYHSMLSRCFDKNNTDYHHYGGRGITVCARWQGLSGFENFVTDMFSSFVLGLTLDRVDNEKDYSPENCRWANRSVQTANTRRNINITANGETRIIAEWSRRTGLTSNQIARRIANGWAPEEALATPANVTRRPNSPDPHARNITVDGVTLSITGWSKRTGISTHTIRGRLRRGCSPEKAVITPVPPKSK
jgi:hypothetical protein